MCIDIIHIVPFVLGRYAEIARNTLRKDQRMNIRISRTDLNGIRAKAAEEGIPYQTLVAGLIHKYVAGHPPASPGKGG